MPTQNPWAWVGIGMGTQCRVLEPSHNITRLLCCIPCDHVLHEHDCPLIWDLPFMGSTQALIMENRQLITDELVEFDK